MLIEDHQIDDLCRGAAFLGAGGGGDPYIGGLMLRRALGDKKRIEIIEADSLADDDLVLPTAMMGAPTVLLEKVPSGLEAVNALKALEREIGRSAVATMPIEVGGINSTIPLWVGAQLGIPIVDADGMGRAFPELQMETFAVYGVTGSPLAIVNEHGDNAVIRATSNAQMEWMARGLTIRFGGCAYISEYAMTGAEVKRTAIRGTLSLAIAIGRVIREAREDHRNPFDALIDYLPRTLYSRGKLLFTGKIIDVSRRTERGFVLGRVTIESAPAESGTLVIDFQNENLIACKNGVPVAIVPDIVIILDAETAEPITTETLRYGQRVRVMGVRVPDIMTTPQALQVFGPRGFGLSTTYFAVA